MRVLTGSFKQGKGILAGYCYHVGMVNAGGTPTMTLCLTSDAATTFNVEIYGGTILQSGSIAPGQVVTVGIPSTYFRRRRSFHKQSYPVTATKPKVVYSYITRSQASGATLCLPTTVLGKEHYSMNFTQVSNEPNSNSYVTIVAVENNTTIEITPSANTKNGWVANNVYTVNLNKGQIYQVLGALDGANATTGIDLTGTYVRSISSGRRVQKKSQSFQETADVTYANHIGLNATTNLAGGFSAGITKIGIDRSKTDFSGTGDPNDPAAGAVYDGYINEIRPDLGVGLWLYSRDYFVGFSAQQVVPQKLSFADDALVPTSGRVDSSFVPDRWLPIFAQ